MRTWALRALVAAAVLGAIYGVGVAAESMLMEYAVRIVLLCGIYAILAMGLNLASGTTGQFSIGHAGFMAVGAYGCALTVITLEDTQGAWLSGLGAWLGPGVALNIGLLVGGVCAGVAGFLVGVPSLRLRGDYLAIVTLGFGEIIRLVLTNTRAVGGATGYSGGRPLGLPLYTNFFWVFTWVVLVVVLMRNLKFSSDGRALAAIREDEIAAESMGIPTTRMKVMAFVLSAAATGVAGGLFAHLQSTVRPDDFKFDRSVDMLVMIIVGGLGSITGAIVGAIVVALSLELMRDIQQFRLVAYALLLVLLMILRPDGLLGRYEFNPARLLRLGGRRP